jgi:hypothetical protein
MGSQRGGIAPDAGDLSTSPGGTAQMLYKLASNPVV